MRLSDHGCVVRLVEGQRQPTSCNAENSKAVMLKTLFRSTLRVIRLPFSLSPSFLFYQKKKTTTFYIHTFFFLYFLYLSIRKKLLKKPFRTNTLLTFFLFFFFFFFLQQHFPHSRKTCIKKRINI